MKEGYILLPRESRNGYYGIDRGLFEPLLMESEFEQYNPEKKYTTISSFYPDGWRKAAYELYELNQVNVDGTCPILKNYKTAFKIRELIVSHLGDYDIFFTQIANIAEQFSKPKPGDGFDFAYPGGDYYSAINNGLFINGSESLADKYGSYLNGQGLFNDPSLFEDYIRDFKTEIQSETDSTFCIYLLIKQ